MAFLSALAFAVVISIDTLPAGFAYGAGNIKVPLRHVVVLNIIGSVLVSIALFSGLYISRYISQSATKILSCTILVVIGIYKLIVYFRKSIKKIDKTSRVIKWPETIILAIVLSFDGIVLGIGVSIYNSSLFFCLSVIMFSLVTDFVFFIFGHKIGQKATRKTRFDLSWLSGVVLIILGLVKL